MADLNANDEAHRFRFGVGTEKVGNGGMLLGAAAIIIPLVYFGFHPTTEGAEWVPLTAVGGLLTFFVSWGAASYGGHLQNTAVEHFDEKIGKRL